MTIYEKILAIMQEVQYLSKDSHVKFASTDYKALSEEKVTAIMREKLAKYHLVVYPIEQSTSRTGTITHVDVKYRMVNADNPEESIVIASCGDGADSQDKGSGKAMTYAYKYMWLRTFALPTGEDPDKVSSEELDAQAAKQSEIQCADCGRLIQPTQKRDGSTWPVSEMAEYSTRRFGRPLCVDCMKALKKAGEQNA